MSWQKTYSKYEELSSQELTKKVTNILKSYQELILNEIEKRGSLTKEQCLSTFDNFSKNPQLLKTNNSKGLQIDNKSKKKKNTNKFNNLKSFTYIVESSDDDSDSYFDEDNKDKDNENIIQKKMISLKQVSIKDKNLLTVYFSKENKLIKKDIVKEEYQEYYLDLKSDFVFNVSDRCAIGILKDDTLITDI